MNGKLTTPVVVQTREGKYYRDRTFVLEAQDSGTKECPITYRACPDENVQISGGKRITGQWKPYNDRIMVCNVPEVKEGKLYFHDLFINGKRQTRARMPDTGFYNVARTITGPDSHSAFIYKSGDLKRWTNLTDIELLIFHSWDEARLRVAELDEGKNIVRFTGASHYPFDYWKGHFNGVCDRYFVENVFEGLDKPGEWYLNRHTGDLFYYPVPGENIRDAEVIAPLIEQLVLCKGDTLNKKPVQYVCFSGFTFCETDWGMAPEGYKGGWGDLINNSVVTFSYAERCVVEKCTITNIGNYAIELSKGSAYITIDRNEISHCGSGGIMIDAMPTKRNVVSNNHIHHCSEIYPSGIGICVGISAQNTISHNHVHDIGYCGFTCGGPENIFEYNHVHDVMQRLSDGGGIYVYETETDGTIIRNNVFHDVHPYVYFGWGIYLDIRTEHVAVMNNIVYRTLSGGTHIHGGSHNVWQNNIFVDSGQYQIFLTTYGGFQQKNNYEKNIFYYTNPESELIHNVPTWTFDAIEKSDYNLFFCKGGGKMKITGIPEVETFEQWQRKGLDFHSVVADPLFVDPEHDNYMLKENSPAFKLGFQQIDVSSVGVEE